MQSPEKDSRSQNAFLDVQPYSQTHHLSPSLTSHSLSQYSDKQCFFAPFSQPIPHCCPAKALALLTWATYEPVYSYFYRFLIGFWNSVPPVEEHFPAHPKTYQILRSHAFADATLGQDAFAETLAGYQESCFMWMWWGLWWKLIFPPESVLYY